MSLSDSVPFTDNGSRAAVDRKPRRHEANVTERINEMTHREFYNNAVNRARGMNCENGILTMLGVIANSLAAIADSLENMEGSIESDNMWTEGRDL